MSHPYIKNNLQLFSLSTSPHFLHLNKAPHFRKKIFKTKSLRGHTLTSGILLKTAERAISEEILKQVPLRTSKADRAPDSRATEKTGRDSQETTPDFGQHVEAYDL